MKIPFLSRRAKPSDSFGLDIGSSSVKAIQLRPSDDGYTLRGLGVVPLPQDTIADGGIKDAPTVVRAIREAVGKAGIEAKDAVIGICGRELIIKKIEIPEVPENELGDAIQLEAEHHIPFAAEEVFLDHHVVGRRGNVMDVLLVAVKKAKVTEYAAAQIARSSASWTSDGSLTPSQSSYVPPAAPSARYCVSVKWANEKS